MKLFGKRKKTSSAIGSSSTGKIEAEAVTEQQQQQQQQQQVDTKEAVAETETNIPSYFSNDYKPPSSVEAESAGSTKKKNQINTDIEALLNLDPESLNSKQRRLIKRHKERILQQKEGVATVTASDVTTKEEEIGGEGEEKEVQNYSYTKINTKQNNEIKSDEVQASKSGSDEQVKNSSSSDSSSSDSDSDSDSDSNSSDNEGTDESDKNTKDTETKKDATATNDSEEHNNVDEFNENVSKIINQLQTLNSKERRKLLRQLESDETKRDLVAKVKEESKKVAEQNELLEKEKQELALLEQKKKKEENQRKRKSEEAAVDDDESGKEKNEKGEEKGEQAPQSNIKGGSSTCSSQPKKKKRKWKDFSDLPPEERERREKQRLMQMEAAARRANGEVDTTRHPLNSERRRANRRKPGRAGKIAMLKKQMREKQENLRIFNASGYHMRRSKKSDGGSETN